MKKARFILALCVVAGVAATALAQEDANLIPNRLSFAKVGEWASYSLPNGYIQKLTVVKRFGEGPLALVTVQVDNIYGGKVVDSKQITQEAGDPFTSPGTPPDDGVIVSVRNDLITLKGRQEVAGVVEITKDMGTEDQSLVEWWTNAEIPVFGIFKKVDDGAIAWQLADWGFDADLPENPKARKPDAE